MSKKRNLYSTSFKSKIALITLKLKGDQNTSEDAARFQIYPTIISAWKRDLMANAFDFLRIKIGLTSQPMNPAKML